MMIEAKKLGMVIPVSCDLAETKFDLFGLLLAEQRRWEALTPEQRAREMEQRAQAEAARAAEMDALHDDVRRKAHYLLRPILDLHRPVTRHGSVECGGCEFGGYEAEPPPWPCATYQLAGGIDQ